MIVSVFGARLAKRCLIRSIPLDRGVGPGLAERTNGSRQTRSTAASPVATQDVEVVAVVEDVCPLLEPERRVSISR
jgi:hypothetical protein